MAVPQLPPLAQRVGIPEDLEEIGVTTMLNGGGHVIRTRMMVTAICKTLIPVKTGTIGGGAGLCDALFHGDQPHDRLKNGSRWIFGHDASVKKRF